MRDELARQRHVDPRLLPPFTGEDIELKAHCCSARDVRRLSKEIFSLRITANHRAQTLN